MSEQQQVLERWAVRVSPTIDETDPYRGIQIDDLPFGGISLEEAQDYTSEVMAALPFSYPTGDLSTLPVILSFEEINMVRLCFLFEEEEYTFPILDDQTSQVIDYLGSAKFQQDMTDKVQNVHNIYGQLILDMAKSLCPVKTGELQSSLYLVELGDGVAIESDCPYYPYVEARYHMVQRAYDFYEPYMLADIDSEVTKGLVIR